GRLTDLPSDPVDRRSRADVARRTRDVLYRLSAILGAHLQGAQTAGRRSRTSGDQAIAGGGAASGFGGLSGTHHGTVAATTAAPEPPWQRRLGAEVFGTFALVFAAAGADVMASVTGDISPAARAVAPALMVTALIYAIGDVSGAHFNPAVTLAFVLKRLLPLRWLAPYWLAQAAGAMLAAIVLAALFPGALASGVSRPHVAPFTALILEI